RKAVAIGIGVSREEDGRIQLFRTQHVDGVTAHVTGRCEPVAGKLVLKRQVPGLDLGRLDIVHRSVIRECRKFRFWTEHYREWIDAVKSCSRRRPWIVENRIVDSRVAAPGRYDRGPQVILAIRIVVADAG